MHWRWNDVFGAAVAIALCQAVGIAGAYITMPAITGWYVQLVKPWFSPPSWVFGPVWTLLYALMGIAAFIVWKAARGAHRRRALSLFALQLFLNAIWSPVFFGLRSPGAALVIIIAMWVSIVATILAFYPIRPVAAYLLVPYLAWVSFASILNAAIWQLN